MTLKFASPLGATTSLGLSLDAAFAAFDLAIENMFAEENADAQGISGTYYLDGIKHSLYDTNCLKDVAADQESAATDSAFEIGDRSEPSDISFDVPTWDSQPLYETAKDATVETAALVSGVVSGPFAAEHSGSAASSNEVCGDELLGPAETNRTSDVFDGSTQHSSVTGRAVETSTDGNASRESFATIGIAESSSSIVSAASPVMVSAGATVEIDGASAATVTFAGATGAVVLDDALAFTGKVSGLTGSDALDLTDVSFGSDTTATYLGNTAGGTLTVTDGIHTANIALQGDYLSSTWTLGSDGNGGTTVVDPVSTNTWQALPIGAGGFLDGFSIAQDGTMVVRTDTYGAYIWNGTEWQQLITSTSMPAAFVANAQLYNQGVLELQIAPSDSSVLYMVYAVSQANTYPPLEGVYVSTNQGATWTLTSFAPIADTTMNANGPYRGWGQNMAIDPTNPDIVYVGTGANGLFVTTDGGNTWSSVSGVPVATSDGNGNYPGITGILFDPANTDIIFAASYGNGIYETTNGGTSWSKISGGPSSVQQAAISSNGTYYAIDGSNNLWIDASGTWTEALSSVAGVAVDPFNPNHVVVTQGDGRLDESFNSGVTWSGWSSAPTDVASDIPYQAVLGIDANGLTFDPTTPGVLYINSLRSFWTTTLSGNITPSTVPTWTDQGIGIEQLCANEIIVPPIANSTPLVASWDTAVIAPNGSTYASTFGPVANGAVVAGWSIDYASSDPNFIVVLADGGYAGGPQESGYSTNDGQTWNAFPTLPPGGSFGGDIAASTPDNIIFASANGVQPYYTLNGGNTWTPITLPGVSSWSGFIGGYFNDNQVITADRVLANTFYLLDGGVGVFSTTNGGVTWTEVNSSVTSGHQLVSTPGDAGDLWLVSGTSQNPGNQGPGGGAGGSLLHSTNGGVTWTTIANVDEPYCIGFGAAAPGQSYPAIYMVGWVNSVYGVWQSINEAQSWTQIGTWPNGSLDKINTIAGDPNVFGKVYVGFAGSGYEVFSADGPSVLEIDTSPSSGLGEIGTVVTLKLAMSEVTTISGGTPTLTLNDGGTATYVSGSGTDALTFSYTAAAGQNTAALAATAINLNGATMADSGGNAANLSLSGLTQSGPQIDTAVTTITTVAQSANGVLEPGATTTLTLDMSEVVTVAGGTPTLTLNNGGTATYSGGSGTGALTFIYTVGSGQSISSLAATAVDLNGATITNANGAANLSLSGLTQGGPQVEGTPTLAIDGNGFSSSYSPTSSSANVTLTTANPNDVIILNISENGATVASVSDTAGLTWHERAVAGSSGALLYQYYAVAPNALSADTITVNFAATPSYDALNAFGIAGANTASPFDSNASVPATANGGTVAATTSEADDLIFADYRFYSSTPASGAGWTAIQAGAGGIMSEYQIVSATQSALVATDSTGGENAGIVDAIVQAASGPATITTVAQSANGVLEPGATTTLTLDMSEVVTVAGGTPTLTLNNGGTATYSGGSGTGALTFIYTVGSGQSISSLAATAVDLNGATITNANGAANLSLSGLTQGGPQVEGTPTLAIDGNGFSSSYSPTSSSANVTLTTANPNDVIILNISENGATVASVSDTAGLTWHERAVAGSSGALLYQYYAVAPNALSADTITVNFAATPSYDALNAFGIAGANTASPFDSNASVPATANGGTVAATTSEADDLIFADYRFYSSTPASGAGWTAIQAGAGGIMSEYQIVSATQSALVATDSTGGENAGIVDAIVQAAAPMIGPAITSLTESPSSGDFNAGKTVTLTLNLSEVVTVNTTGGSPTLTLNDGSTATYVSGSGTNALVFNYTVGANQNTSVLAATAVNLGGATIQDGAGNAANLSLTGLNQSGPQIDTTTPTVSSVTTSGTGISNGTGDLDAGKTVTLTVNMSEAVTVTGGTPTLTLNDSGTATYVSGSGTNALVFSYTVLAGQSIADLAVTAFNANNATIADGAGNAATLTGAVTNPAGTLQIDTTTPTVTSLTESPSSGDFNAGKTVTLTLNLSEVVTVNTTGGTPTLTLNDGSSATYVSGSGTNALVFNYTVGANQNTSALTATAVNLGGATIADGAGNAANLSLTGLTQSGPQIDTTTPTITSLTESPSSGDFNAGKTVTLTLNLSEVVTVNTTGGTPKLTLNDGSTATYVSGSGTNALVFSYTVGANQNTSALAATAVNLGGATIQDGAGNAANLSLTGLTQSGPQIDTTTPTITSLTESPSSGDFNAGKVITLTLTMNEIVTVNTTSGSPTLTLNDGSTATYVSGSGTNALVFNYTVGANQNTSVLAATAVNLGGATIQDGAGNAANLSLTGLNQSGPQIDTTTPTVSSVTTSGTGISNGTGDLDAGKTVTLTVNMSEAVTVTGGTPTLTLNDSGTATYVSGSGTNALVFSYTVLAGQSIADLAVTAFNANNATIADGAGNAATLTGAVTNPAGTLQIDTTTPTVTSLTESPSSGDFNAGKTVTLTLNLSEVVTVNTTGGTPTLTLNDGSSATYVSGSGTNALVFNYTVGANQNTSALTATAVNLGGATIADGAGNAANLSLTGLTQSGPQIDTTTPTITSLTESPSSGDFNAGKTVTLTLNLSEVVTVNTTGGTPKLTLNDGSTATYVSGSGTNALVFSYTVSANQNTSALTATAVSLGGATIADGAGNAANLSLTGLTQSGPQIDTTTPTITSLTESPSSGDFNAGKTVTLTLNLSEVVTVNTTGGSPTLTLNDGSTATYVSGSGTNALVFNYTVGANQNTSALAATAVNLGGATIQDGAGNAANLSLTGLTQSGPQIDTTTPTVSSVTTSGTGISNGTGDLDAGKTVTLTVNMSEAVTVTGGTPTLTLNDSGTATYVSGSGTNALVFSYTVLAGQSIADLAVTAFNANNATIADGAGNAATLTGAVTNPAGTLQIDTTTPTVTSLTESPSSGDFNAGKTVTLTLNLSEVVTVNTTGGTPTLTLNDGSTATYVSGSGTNALVFNYTVGANQNTSALTATAVNLGGATIADGAGNAANLSLTGLTQSGPQIDTTTPTITSLTESPSSGDFNAGKTVTLTLNLSEAVTVNTTGGTPTLTLNDGSTATYVSGSGTNALVFNYTVGANQNTSALTATAVSLGGATIADGAGNAANLSLTGLTQSGPQIDTTTPTISSIADSPPNGDFNAGKVITLTLTMNEIVTVNTTSGSPTLTLDDDGTATYVSGSGTNALVFSYTVLAGQNTSDLTVSAVNLNLATVTDGAGNVANLSLTGLTQGSPQIDTTTPTITSLIETPSSGDVGNGQAVTLTMNLSEAVTVAGGIPTLALNDGGIATYAGGSGTSALTFSYTVLAGQSTASLAATAVNLNGATIQDGASNAANLSLTELTQSGPLIDTTTPAVTSIVDSTSGGTLDVGDSVTLTLDFSEAVTVTGDAPSLTLNDDGNASYVSGSGTNALTFSYTVSGTDGDVAALAATSINLNGGSIQDGAGNNANLSLTGLSQTGPQTTVPLLTVTQINEIYQSVLQRLPTTAEVNAAVAMDATIGNAATLAVVIDSSQAKEEVYPIVQIIDLATGSLPSAGQLAGWIHAVENGISLDQMATAFVASTAFGVTYNDGTAVNPNSPITATIMQAIIEHANGTTPTVAQVNAWVNTGLTVDQVFVDFALGDQYAAASQTGIQQYLSATAENSALIIGAASLNIVPPSITVPEIDEIYQSVLQRAPIGTEVNAALAIDSTIGNAGLVAAIVNSPEAQQFVYPIMQIIDLATGSLPTATQLAGWVPAVESGISLDQMATAFVASTAFGVNYNDGTAVNPNSPITATIMQAIIEHADGTAPTTAQVNAWVNTGLTVDQVFVDFALGDQYAAASKLSNQQYLISLANNAIGVNNGAGAGAAQMVQAIGSLSSAGAANTAVTTPSPETTHPLVLTTSPHA